VSNKRLFNLAAGSKRWIWTSVLLKWLGLLCHIALILSVGFILENLAQGVSWTAAAVCVTAPVLRYFCVKRAADCAVRASGSVKAGLRTALYQKLLKLWPDGMNGMSTAALLQIATEGCEQLEVYFDKYIPQFFYGMAAPLTLFAVLAFFDLPSAAVALACAPLIPAFILLGMKFAKKTFSKYWGAYTDLGERFLDNLQGLTTLKIYGRDAAYHEKMNGEAERFRRATMKVLTMQLQSISVMDVMAFGFAALSAAVALAGFANGRAGLWAAFAVVALSAEFFVPLRQLGSYFHIAMNGMTAADRIFAFLDRAERKPAPKALPEQDGIRFSGVTFSYGGGAEVLKDVSFTVPQNSFVSFAGKSGCGKSTVAALLAGKFPAAGVSLPGGKVIAVPSDSYIFAGTVRDNLKMARPAATDAEMADVLKQVCLFGELGTLDYEIKERGANLSGGQRQRLAIARALLSGADVYIFDEATSGVDVESEEIILSVIAGMKGEKTVVLISHRLYNMKDSDMIYVLDGGAVAESGKHGELLDGNGLYAAMYREQEGTQ
jgi:ABC-type transport system involved in cytochrome bd biosynthesis fused ATPase/permease subunit